MATIAKDFGTGGAGLAPGGSASPSLLDILNGIVDDLTELRTKHNAAMAKLDADAGVTDTNYAATCNAAALVTIKG